MKKSPFESSFHFIIIDKRFFGIENASEWVNPIQNCECDKWNQAMPLTLFDLLERMQMHFLSRNLNSAHTGYMLNVSAKSPFMKITFLIEET